jgi:hypothetical protein
VGGRQGLLLLLHQLYSWMLLLLLLGLSQGCA